MKTIEEIEIELRGDCPTIDGSVPGEAHYDATIAKFVAARVEHLSRLAEIQSRKIWPDASAFLFEFTMPELAAISLSLDPTIAALRLLLASWPADIYSDDPRIVGGLSALVAAGIITEARRKEILAK